jgi:hypothetical protein
MALKQVKSQMSYLFVTMGPQCNSSLHAELGSFQVMMADAVDQGIVEDFPAGRDSVGGPLMLVPCFMLQWGQAFELTADQITQKSGLLHIEATSSQVYCNLSRLHSILFNAIAMNMYLKALAVERFGSGKRAKGSSSSSSMMPWIRSVELLLEGICFQMIGPLQKDDDNMVPDPKTDHFRSQDTAEVTVTHMGHMGGGTNTASIHMAECNRIRTKYKAIADVSHLYIFFICNRRHVQATLEEGHFLYQELNFGDTIVGEVAALHVLHMNGIYQASVVDMFGIGSCAFVSVTDAKVHWEPDLHLFFHEALLQVKAMLYQLRSLLLPFDPDGNREEDLENNHKGKWSLGQFTVALDVEGLDFNAEVADGVDLEIHVHSMFSEDVEIGLLLEGLQLSLNHAIVLRSEQLQMSRSCVNHDHPKGEHARVTDFSMWDHIIHSRNMRITMPFRIPLRAIEDAIEDMWKVLQLALAGQRRRFNLQVQKKSEEDDMRIKKTMSFWFRKLTFVSSGFVVDIEEEPCQAWFDLHHHLLADKVCELIAREQLLENEVLIEQNKNGSWHAHTEVVEIEETNGLHKLIETDLLDPVTVKKEWERLHQRTFNAYHKACEKLSDAEVSGISGVGFQAGFKPSSMRQSLASVQAARLEVFFTQIEGGREGMIDIIHRLDCVGPDAQVPFSRVMGRNVRAHASHISVQIRDYSSPILSALHADCTGIVILAQQVCFPSQTLDPPSTSFCLQNKGLNPYLQLLATISL